MKNYDPLPTSEKIGPDLIQQDPGLDKECGAEPDKSLKRPSLKLVLAYLVSSFVISFSVSFFLLDFATLLEPLVFRQDALVRVDSHVSRGRLAQFGPLLDSIATLNPSLDQTSTTNATELTTFVQYATVPDYGCFPNTTAVLNKVAVVQRGGCLFYEKVLAMQECGAVAVVVGDPDHSELVYMVSGGAGQQNGSSLFSAAHITIPAVYVDSATFSILQTAKTGQISLEKASCDWGDRTVGLIPLLAFVALLFYARYKQKKNV